MNSTWVRDIQNSVQNLSAKTKISSNEIYQKLFKITSFTYYMVRFNATNKVHLTLTETLVQLIFESQVEQRSA